MKKTPFERLIAEKTLAAISSQQGESIVEYAISSGELEPTLKNICTKVTISLADEIDNICTMLSISKRKFCETAFIDAIQKAKKIMEDEGLYDLYDEDLSDDARDALEEARQAELDKQAQIREALA